MFTDGDGIDARTPDAGRQLRRSSTIGQRSLPHSMCQHIPRMGFVVFVHFAGSDNRACDPQWSIFLPFSGNLSLPDRLSPIFSYLRFVYNGGWIYLLRLNNPLCVKCRGEEREKERGERDLHSCREIRSMFRIIKKISNRRAQDLVLISALMEILEIYICRLIEKL